MYIYDSYTGFIEYKYNYDGGYTDCSKLIYIHDNEFRKKRQRKKDTSFKALNYFLRNYK